MKVARQPASQRQNTLSFFTDEIVGGVEASNRQSDAFGGAVKGKDGIDPEMVAAERIARQLRRESNGPKITSKSREKGNEICDHLIASLRNQPEQGMLGF